MRSPKIKSWFFVLGMTFFSLVLHGYHYGNGEMSFYVPMIRKMLEPGFLAGDWFLNLAPYHQNILWLIGKISFLFGLPLSFFIFHFLSVFIYLAATYLIVRELTKNKNTALVVMAILGMIIPCGLGGYYILTDYFVPGSLAYGLILFSLYFFLKEKYLAMFFLAFLAGKVHFLAGLNWLILISPYYFYIVIKKRKYKEIFWLTLMFVGLLGSDLLPLVALQKGMAGFDKIFLSINVFFRYPHHYLLTSHGILNILFFAIFILFILRKIKVFFFKKDQQKIVYLICGLVFFMLANLFFVDLWPTTIIAKLQLLRLTFLPEYFFIIIFSLVVRPLWPVLLIFLPAFAYFFADQTVQAFFIIMLMIYVLGRVKKQKKNLNVRPAYLFFLILVWLVFFALNFTQKITIDLPISNDPWLEVCSMAKEISDPGAIFLVPPDLDGFRLLADRTIVVDFKACPYLEKDTTEWLRRIKDIGGILPPTLNVSGFALLPILAKNYDSLSWSRIQQLRRKYGVNYVITRTTYPLRRPLYKNNKFYIYSL